MNINTYIIGTVIISTVSYASKFMVSQQHTLADRNGTFTACSPLVLTQTINQADFITSAVDIYQSSWQVILSEQPSSKANSTWKCKMTKLLIMRVYCIADDHRS